MKKIIFFLGLLFVCLLSEAQTYPPSSGSGSVPSSKTYWYQGDFLQGLNGIAVGIRDTNFIPRFAGTMVFWQHAGVDSLFWVYNGVKWNVVTPQNPGIDNTVITWSVLDSLNTPSVSAASGDKYEVGLIPTGAFVGHEKQIATYNGASYTFETASIGDLLYNAATDFVSKLTSTRWIRVGKATIHQGGDIFGAPMIIGTSDNQHLNLKTNNIVRLQIAKTGTYKFVTLNGSGNGLMGLDATGLASRVMAGSGINITGSTISATGGASLKFAVSGEDATATQNRAFAVAGFDFSISGATNFTLSANNYNLIEGINRTTINSLDSTYILGANALTLASVNIASRATTSNVWGYTTSKLWTANTSGMFLTGGNFSSAATDKIAHIDTTNGKLTWGWVDQTSQIIGITPVANGGTGRSSLTANNVILGNGTSAVNFVAPGSSGNVLTSNGTTWTSAAAASNYWTVGQYGALASTNIFQPISAVIGDTVVIGSGLASFGGKNNIAGSLYTNSNFYAAGTGRIDGATGIGGAPNGAISLFVQGPGSVVAFEIAQDNIQSSLVYSTSPGTGSYFSHALNASQLQRSSYSGASEYVNYLAVSNNEVDGSAGQTSASIINYSSSITTSSNSSTPIGRAVGFSAATGKVNSRLQRFTNVYGFLATVSQNAVDTILAASGVGYGFYADSVPVSFYSDAGKYFGVFQKTNIPNTIKNNFESNTLIGTGTQNASAALEVISTTQGILFPRMTTTQRDAIASPAAGLVIYNTTTNKLNVYTTAWEAITSL